MRSAKMLERQRKVDVSRIMVFWFDAHGANLPKVQPAAERPGFASGPSVVASLWLLHSGENAERCDREQCSRG